MINPLQFLLALVPLDASPAADKPDPAAGKADFQQLLSGIERLESPVDSGVNVQSGGNDLPPLAAVLPSGLSQMSPFKTSPALPPVIASEALPPPADSIESSNIPRENLASPAVVALWSRQDPVSAGLPSPGSQEVGSRPADDDPAVSLAAPVPQPERSIATTLPPGEGALPPIKPGVGSRDESRFVDTASGSRGLDAAAPVANAISGNPISGNTTGDGGRVATVVPAPVGREDIVMEQFSAASRAAGTAEGQQAAPQASIGLSTQSAQPAAPPDRMLQTLAPSLPLDSSAPDALATKLHMLVRRGSQEAILQLQPAELGRLQVSISTEGDQARVLFVADSVAARDAIEHSLPRLREMLAQSGLQLAHSEVFGQASGEGRHESEPFLSRPDASTDPGAIPPPPEFTALTSSGRLLDLYI